MPTGKWRREVVAFSASFFNRCSPMYVPDYQTASSEKVIDGARLFFPFLLATIRYPALFARRNSRASEHGPTSSKEKQYTRAVQFEAIFKLTLSTMYHIIPLSSNG